MISKNLRKRNNPYKKKNNSKIIKNLLIALVVIVPATYGYLNLVRLKPTKEKKTELKVEMGDNPVEKKVKIIIKADGGLNLRKDAEKNSEKIGVIPDGTKLEAKKELGGWYNVDFGGKNGWISKDFTILDKGKVQDATADWLSFSSDTYSFSVKYPRDWTYKDYGATEGTDSIGFVAFSFSELPKEVTPGTLVFIPIEIKILSKPQVELEAPYKSMANKVVSEVDISSEKGVKYVYTDTTDNTEKTKVFFTYNEKTYVISENGGYQKDLENFLKTFKLK